MTREELHQVAGAKHSSVWTAGRAWNEIKRSPFLFLVCGLALILRSVGAAGCWPQHLLDAYIALIPKSEGGSSPIGQRPLCVLLVVYRSSARLKK